ncbi:hypothetical protein Tco_0514095 [Tanacetum coccineum]
MLEYDNEELTIHPTQVFSVLNWALKPNQHEGPPFTDHMNAICNIDVHVDSQALKTSSQTKKVPQGKKPGAKSGLRRKNNLQYAHLDKSPSHHSPSTLVVGEIPKEAQQAAGDLTSLGATHEEGAHPQLSSGSSDDEIFIELKLEDLLNLVKDTRSDFFTPNSPQDEPIIVLDESGEEKNEKDKDTHTTSHDVPEDTSVPHPPSPESAQIQVLMARVHLFQSQKEKLEQQKAKAKAELAY